MKEVMRGFRGAGIELLVFLFLFNRVSGFGSIDVKVHAMPCSIAVW